MAAKKKSTKKSTTARKAPARRRSTTTARKAPARRRSSKKSSKMDMKSMMYTLGAAAVLGFVEAKGIDKRIPQLPMIGTAGTLTAALLAWGHFQKAAWATKLAMGTGSIAAYRLGVQAAGSQPAGVSGAYDDVAAIPPGAAMPVVGVDPRLLAQAADALEEISGDDDVEGDDDDLAGDDDVEGDDDDLAGDDDVEGDDDDLAGDDDE